MLRAAPPGDAVAASAQAARRRTLWRDAALVALALGALAAPLGAAAGFGAGFVATALALFALALPLVDRGLVAHHPHRRFGAANRVTLLRLALVLGLLAAATQPALAGSAARAWALVAIATLAALLDAVDGALARASGLASDFGARFDMETDALLMLVLCLLLLRLGQAGAWVLAAGGMRYAFVAAAALQPWLARPLPPSRRRQAVCVLQIVSLIVGLAPIVPPLAAGALAAAGLVALTASFAADVAWLARRRRLAS